jgi:hypothetical protein
VGSLRTQTSCRALLRRRAMTTEPLVNKPSSRLCHSGAPVCRPLETKRLRALQPLLRLSARRRSDSKALSTAAGCLEAGCVTWLLSDSSGGCSLPCLLAPVAAPRLALLSLLSLSVVETWCGKQYGCRNVGVLPILVVRHLSGWSKA